MRLAVGGNSPWPGLAAFAWLVISACQPRVPFGDDRRADLAALAPGSALDLGRYECDQLPGDGHDCRNKQDWSSFLYDRRTHQMLMFGGGAHSSDSTDVAAFSFDTAKWASAYPSTPCGEMVRDNVDWEKGAWLSRGHPMARQTYDMLAISDRSGELVLLNYNTPDASGCVAWNGGELDAIKGRIAHYHPTRRTWTFHEAPAWDDEAAAELDPISGLVVVVGAYGLWTYDPDSHQVVTQSSWSRGELHYSAQLVYFPPNRRMYYFTRTGPVFEVVLDRAAFPASSVTEMVDIEGPPPPPDAKGWAFDVEHQVLGGGVRDGIFSVLDPVTRRWARQAMAAQSADGATPTDVGFYTLAYDPVDRVFVFLTGSAGGYRTWAYRPL